MPQVEQAGVLTPLVIPDNSGLAEQIHLVFFLEDTCAIVGSEFNFYGPRVSRFRQYLQEKASHICPLVSFAPLLRNDVIQQLTRLDDVRLFRISIKSSYAMRVAQADQDLGSAFEAAARASEAEELEVVLKPPKYSRRERLRDGLLGVARTLLGYPDLRENVSTFHIQGQDRDTGRLELVDVLSDQFIAKKQVVKESGRSRGLQSLSVYAAIEQAYSELRDQLLSAAGVQL